jgi:hypothetical protein
VHGRFSEALIHHYVFRDRALMRMLLAAAERESVHHQTARSCMPRLFSERTL